MKILSKIAQQPTTKLTSLCFAANEGIQCCQQANFFVVTTMFQNLKYAR